LKPTLYVETNFVVAVAKGQDADAAELLEKNDAGIMLVFPAVCFMEALSVLVSERKHWRKFQGDLSSRVREFRRYQGSSRASGLAGDLERSGVLGGELLNEVETRLAEAPDGIALRAEIIETGHDVVHECLNSDYLDDPTDRLILCSALRHARRNPGGPKAFLSGNKNDFGLPAATAALESAGVKFFPRTRGAIGWLKAQATGG
jgi:hypothetical protein